ncbi:MAG: methyltransferase domain-containing protein [Elusimicrobiota bacterium]
MKPTKDAYGKEIWARYKKKSDIETIERDDGYSESSPGFASIYFSPHKEWSEHDNKAIKLVKGRVLDVGCGAGRHSLYLQGLGFDVTAIDNSPLAVKVCRLRGIKKAKVISVTQTGKFKAGSFDTIIMMGNNFGLMGGFRQARRILKAFYRITSPGGRIIAETTDPYKTDFPPHLKYQAWNRRRGRMSGQLRIRAKFGKCRGPWFDYLFVSREELKDILSGTRWKIEKLINTKTSKYMMILHKK